MAGGSGVRKGASGHLEVTRLWEGKGKVEGIVQVEAISVLSKEG